MKFILNFLLLLSIYPCENKGFIFSISYQSNENLDILPQKKFIIKLSKPISNNQSYSLTASRKIPIFDSNGSFENDFFLEKYAQFKIINFKKNFILASIDKIGKKSSYFYEPAIEDSVCFESK